MHLTEMKIYCKKQKCTVNDYCAALLSNCLHDFLSMEADRQRKLKQKVYEVPPTVRFTIPFSMRQPIKKIEEVILRNDFGSVWIDFKVLKNFDQCLKNSKEEFTYMKGSLKPFGCLYTQMVPMLYPFGFDSFIQNFVMSKFTAILSNVIASTEPYVVCGKKYKEHFMSIPGLQEISNTFMFSTVGTRMCFSITTDEMAMTDPQEFADILDKRNKEIIGIK